MDAWADLSTERPIGMAEGYIPRSKIKQYASEDLGLDGDPLELFISVIRRCDHLYLTGNSIAASDPRMLEQVPTSDGAGVRSLLHRLAAKPQDGGDRFTKKAARRKS